MTVFKTLWMMAFIFYKGVRLVRLQFLLVCVVYFIYLFIYSVYSRGVLANAAEFLGCTCCQSDSDKLDWTKTYSLPKKYQKSQPGGDGASESDEGNVRIPLPFSRTWDPTQDKLEKARKKFKK